MLPVSAPKPEEFLGSDRFLVEIDGLTVSSFLSVVLAEGEADVIEYRQGSDPSQYAFKLPGRIRYSSVTLVRGVSKQQRELYDWWSSVATGPAQRRNLSIVALDDSGQEAVRWNVYSAWPRLYRVSPFEAESDAIVCETLELACERVERA
jgi:phage tail-like protein